MQFPNGHHLSPNPGFRRGEGGKVDVGWALMVAQYASTEAMKTGTGPDDP